MPRALNPELTELPLERLRLRRSVKWARYPADVLPAFVAEMDFPLAEPVRVALAEAVELDDAGYAWPQALGLAEAFAEFAERRLGWSVDPARVSPASDVVGAITSVLAELTEPGHGVVINSPVYHPFFGVVEELGRELVEAPLVDGELDAEAVEACFAAGARALILCSPHNPVGTTPSREQLVALAAAAARHGAWVLADEIHAPLTLPGAEHVPYLAASEEAAAHGIAFSSASKTFNLAGLHCAQIVTASDQAAAVIGRLPFLATHCAHFGAIGAVAAFRHGDAWLDDVLAVLDHNRGLLADLLAEHLPEVGYTPPRAGYLAWLDLRQLGLGDDPAATLLERGKVALSPGPDFGRQGAGFARLNFGTSPALLEEAVERIAKGAGRA
ncbi:MAG TPA: aminotransferase class I/II-fold pyridoxal phosphate-dependent enzyme [Solirubrobacterales bacterium]|nr:aminotransferase class I/II-fold pyridoxal phosphate-dependent enzyme [Solirubrobacterales bacterium]